MHTQASGKMENTTEQASSPLITTHTQVNGTKANNTAGGLQKRSQISRGQALRSRECIRIANVMELDSAPLQTGKCALVLSRAQIYKDLERMYQLIKTNTSETSKMTSWTDSDGLNLQMAMIIQGVSRLDIWKEEELTATIEEAANIQGNSVKMIKMVQGLKYWIRANLCTKANSLMGSIMEKAYLSLAAKATFQQIGLKAR